MHLWLGSLLLPLDYFVLFFFRLTMSVHIYSSLLLLSYSK